MCSLDGRSETSTGAIPGGRTRASLGEVCEDRLDGFRCPRNAPGFVCLVGWSFWSVWFFWSVWSFWMNFRSDQPDRRDRPDEPALVGCAQWKINQPPSLKRSRASLEGCEGQPGRPPARRARRGWTLMIFCARARARLSGWLVYLVHLSEFSVRPPDKPDRRDRPDEPAFVGRAQ